MTGDLSRHAAKRCQQRAIPPIAVELVMRFGHRERAAGGVDKIYLNHVARRQVEGFVGRRILRAIEEHLDIYLVVSDDGTVITAAHRLERIKRH